MTMAADAKPPVGGPRSCTWADGRAKATYASLAIARRVAKRTAPDLKPYTCDTCGSTHIGHRPPERLTCALCGSTDGTVATTVTRTGERWAPTCAQCSADIREKSARVAAVERAVRA